MAIKTPYDNEELPPVNFPWALKVSGFEELLLVSGHADLNRDSMQPNFPDDLTGQAKYALQQIDASIESAGFSLNDAIRTEITLSKEVRDEQLPELFKLLESWVSDVEVKPAAGTLRFVDRLISRACLVEIEVMLAR